MLKSGLKWRDEDLRASKAALLEAAGGNPQQRASERLLWVAENTRAHSAPYKGSPASIVPSPGGGEGDGRGYRG